MEKEFIPLAEATALKELGFKERCFAFYNIVHTRFHSHTVRYPADSGNIDNWNKESYLISAALYQQAFKCFREEHKLFVEIGVDQTSYPKYCVEISHFIGNPKDLTKEWGWEKIPNDEFWGLYRKYEEAELAAVRKLIQIVKQKVYTLIKNR